MKTFFWSGKWTKFQLMRSFKELREHLPQTRRMTKKAFTDLLVKYRDIVVKPDFGSRGEGVCRISEVGQDLYVIHMDNIQTTVTGKEKAYESVRSMGKMSSHIVQRRIPLATIDGRPFDLRVIVQRKKLSDAWKVTGKVAKVAGEGYIVTNIEKSKGSVLPLKTALERSSLKHCSRRALVSDINKVSLLSAERLGNTELYSDQRVFGMDLGLDQDGHVWVIEVNLAPLFSHFRYLKDKTMYRRIMEYDRG
jgi:YheC/D like ATP-grasp